MGGDNIHQCNNVLDCNNDQKLLHPATHRKF